MKLLLAGILVFVISMVHGQQNNSISAIDDVEIISDNKEEAFFDYKNNWQVLRKKAIEKGYIHSYQVLETPFSKEAPFHLLLITTYANEEQYVKREDHFAALIMEKGPQNY